MEPGRKLLCEAQFKVLLYSLPTMLNGNDLRGKTQFGFHLETLDLRGPERHSPRS